MSQIDLGQVPGMHAPAIAELNRLGLYFTSDLMRSNRTKLVTAAQVSINDLRRWQSFAALCEIEGLTPERAGSLLAAGIDRFEEFFRKPIATLRGILQTGASPMNDDEIIRAMVSARHLLSTGVLNGTAVTTLDVPLEGAIAHIGGRTAVSDARGRFRIPGLRLGQTYALSLSHPQKRAKVFANVAVHPSSALIGRMFKLTGRPAPEIRRSALIGDVLPPFGTAPMTSEMRNEALSPEDRYVLSEFYANGDGKLGSLFLDYYQGRFIIRCYRVAQASLPGGAALGDRFILEGGDLVKAKITAGKIGRLSRTRAVKKHYRGKPMTPQKLAEMASKILKALKDPK